jgi:hypothetical protein
VTNLRLRNCSLPHRDGGKALCRILEELPKLNVRKIDSDAFDHDVRRTFMAASDVDLDDFVTTVRSHGSLQELTLELAPECEDLPAIETLLAHGPKVLTLQVDECILPLNMEVVYRGLQHLGSAVRVLDLRYTPFEMHGLVHGRILECLRLNATLVELRLGREWIYGRDFDPTDDFCVDLEIFLRTNRILRFLWLHGLTERVVTAIVTGLCHNRTLETIKVHDITLYEEPLPGRILSDMVDMLRYNYTICRIDGLPFPEDDPVATQAEFLLRLNACGRRILFEPPRPRPFGLPLLSEAEAAEAEAWSFSRNPPPPRYPGLQPHMLAWLAKASNTHDVIYHYLKRMAENWSFSHPSPLRRGRRRRRRSTG